MSTKKAESTAKKGVGDDRKDQKERDKAFLEKFVAAKHSEFVLTLEKKTDTFEFYVM